MLNNKYQNVLIKFGLWLGTGIAIALVGISNVFADITNNDFSFIGYTYNQTWSTSPNGTNSGTTWIISDNNLPYIYIDICSTGETSTSIVNINNVQGNVSYLGATDLKIRCSIGSYNPTLVRHYFKVNTWNQVSSSFDEWNVNFTMNFKNNASWNIQSQVKNIATGNVGFNNDDAIINNQNQNTQNIINNNNNNTQEIINNQNQNTQDLIDSNKVCTTKKFDNTSITHVNKALNGSGNLYDANNFGVSDFISIDNSVSLTVLDTLAVYTCFYDNSKNSTGCISTNTLTSLNIPNNSKFIRITFSSISNKPILELYTCKNGNQALDDSINDLNSSLTDSSPVDMGSLGNTAGWLPPGPIDSIINLPLNLFNNLLTALNGTCQPINIPLPYVDKNLPIPCISTIFNQITGLPTFWNWVGAITSVVILYRYLLALYKYYDDLTTLKANFISDFGGEP